jgi:hypothetical protein
MSDSVRILFQVEQDPSGYPPVSREEIWCLPLSQDILVVDNIPFYARDISLGDEICVKIEDGSRWFASLVKPSSNTTLRVFVHRQAAAPLVISRLRSFGALTEKMERMDLIAVCLPATTDIAGILAYLDRETDIGSVAFEESSVRYR